MVREINRMSQDEITSIIDKLNMAAEYSDVKDMVCQIHSRPVMSYLATLPALH